MIKNVFNVWIREINLFRNHKRRRNYGYNDDNDDDDGDNDEDYDDNHNDDEDKDNNDDPKPKITCLGIIKGDEIMVINGAIVSDLDMMYIESVLQVTHFHGDQWGHYGDQWGHYGYQWGHRLRSRHDVHRVRTPGNPLLS